MLSGIYVTQQEVHETIYSAWATRNAYRQPIFTRLRGDGMLWWRTTTMQAERQWDWLEIKLGTMGLPPQECQWVDRQGVDWNNDDDGDAIGYWALGTWHRYGDDTQQRMF